MNAADPKFCRFSLSDQIRMQQTWASLNQICQLYSESGSETGTTETGTPTGNLDRKLKPKLDETQMLETGTLEHPSKKRKSKPNEIRMTETATVELSDKKRKRERRTTGSGTQERSDRKQKLKLDGSVAAGSGMSNLS